MSRINGVVGGVVRPVVRGLTSNKGVGAPIPPPGFVFFIKPDGTYWTNASGAYYLKAVA